MTDIELSELYAEEAEAKRRQDEDERFYCWMKECPEEYARWQKEKEEQRISELTGWGGFATRDTPPF